MKDFVGGEFSIHSIYIWRIFNFLNFPTVFQKYPVSKILEIFEYRIISKKSSPEGSELVLLHFYKNPSARQYQLQSWEFLLTEEQEEREVRSVGG